MEIRLMTPKEMVFQGILEKKEKVVRFLGEPVLHKAATKVTPSRQKQYRGLFRTNSRNDAFKLDLLANRAAFDKVDFQLEKANIC